MGLQENIAREPVSRLELRNPVLATAQETVRNCIAKMRTQKLGCTVIVDGEKKPIGMLTEGMLTRMVAQQQIFLDDPVSEHMTTQWPWVQLTDPISEVLSAMEIKNTRFLCVLDEEGRIVGLTGQRGLMEYVVEHFPEQVMVQRLGCTPYLQEREGA